MRRSASLLNSTARAPHLVIAALAIPLTATEARDKLPVARRPNPSLGLKTRLAKNRLDPSGRGLAATPPYFLPPQPQLHLDSHSRAG